MTKLTKTESDLLTKLALTVKKQRKYDSLSRALKAESETILSDIQKTKNIAKGDSLKNKTVAVSFTNRKGGGYEIPKWSKFGVDKVIVLTNMGGTMSLPPFRK